MNIHITRNGERSGPFTLEQTNSLLRSGSAKPTDLAWHDGLDGWIPLSSVRGVLDLPTSTFPVNHNSIYGGFWIRFLAYIIDYVLWLIPTLLIFGVFQLNESTANILGYINSFLMIVYFAALESSTWQATPGKKICGLKVINRDGGKLSFLHALGRSILSALCVFNLFIGSLMIAFTKRKQGLHDMVCKTYVVKG